MGVTHDCSPPFFDDSFFSLRVQELKSSQFEDILKFMCLNWLVLFGSSSNHANLSIVNKTVVKTKENKILLSFNIGGDPATTGTTMNGDEDGRITCTEGNTPISLSPEVEAMIRAWRRLCEEEGRTLSPATGTALQRFQLHGNGKKG